MKRSKDSQSLDSQVEDIQKSQTDAKKPLGEKAKNIKNAQQTEEKLHLQDEEKAENMQVEPSTFKEEISKEDFLSFYELEFLLRYFTRNERIDGFRSGKIPVVVLQMKNPGLTDYIFDMKKAQKNDELKEKNLTAMITKIVNEKDGFRIFYEFGPISPNA